MSQIHLPDVDMAACIGKDWMLVAAGTASDWNAMTASWGGVGTLWNRPVAFVFVRPQRYTHQLLEEYPTFSLSFFDASYRPMLSLAGSRSGRDLDKRTALGLTATEENRTVRFAEASLTLICRKLYKASLEESGFLDPSLPAQFYPQKDFHTVYVAEILDVSGE